MPDITFTDPVRLRAITVRPDAPLEGIIFDDPIEACPHWWQIEEANETWLPFTGVFNGNKVTRPPAPSPAVSTLDRAILRAGIWAMSNPSHPVLQAIRDRMPSVHYLAAGPEVLVHDPSWETVTVIGIADDLTILSDSAGRDIDIPTTFGGLIAVAYDETEGDLIRWRPKVTVLYWAVPDELFENAWTTYLQEAASQEEDPGFIFQEGAGPAFTVRPREMYTAVLEYVATGEGMRHQVLVVQAEDKAGARQAFLDRFYPGSSDLQEYFARGVDVYPGIHRPALSPTLSEAYLKHLERKGRNSEFGFWHVFNLS